MKSRTEILVPIAAIQAVPIAVIAWYRLHRYAWYRYSAIVIEENESKNSNLLEMIRSHKYIYGGVRMTIDVSFSIMDTQPFPFNDSLLMVTGVHDQLGPTYSFIVNIENKQAILLPSNRGCLGFTSEEGLPICLSFRHHANGEPGRYSVVSVYDEKGNLVKEMSFEDYKNDEKQ